MESPAFQPRIERTIAGWQPFLGFGQPLDIVLETRNSFPHSAGIASSASAMSALALCFTDAEYMLAGMERSGHFLAKASFLARLGSGSAARSVFPMASAWGEISSLPGSSAATGVPVEDLAEPFRGMLDTILIVDPGEKATCFRRPR